jgi:hypothetical protein
VSFGLDGQEQWRVSQPLREIKASAGGQALMGVGRAPGSRIVHLDPASGAVIGEHTLPTPSWAIGLSADGRFSFAATKTQVFVYLEGTLLYAHAVPHESFASADINDGGEIVVGGKVAGGQTQLYLAGSVADTPWARQGQIDQQAYRPLVRFRPGGRNFVSVENGHLDSFVGEKN